MNQLVNEIETLNEILEALNAGRWNQAAAVAARALGKARHEMELYEEWAEREAQAERAWLFQGAALIADLNGNAENCPF
jgi:hypothetical protein